MITLSIYINDHRIDSSNAKARKVFLCSLWLLPVLLGTFVFHSRVWAEEKIEQQSLMVLTNGEDTLDDQSVLHGTPLNASQPVGVIAALRKQLRAICMHEWIAQYNTTTSTDNNNNNDNKAKEDTNTGTHLCMKLKVTIHTILTYLILSSDEHHHRTMLTLY